MMRRLVRDESGMAMGLAIMVMVIVGVMGAGLLVFVRNDLEAVVEVNQGQRAINLADAGVQAAKRQLRSDAVPAHYDSNSTENLNGWAYVAPSGGTVGRTLNLDEGTAKVTIQYLLPAAATQVGNANYAPKEASTDPSTGQLSYPGEGHYFKVVSEGTAGEARRKVEAILYTSKLDVPTAYYTPKTIEFTGTVNPSGVSFFAKQNIYINSNTFNNLNSNRNMPAIYGDWDTTKFDPPSNFNTTPRTNPSNNQPVTGAGLAAEGFICHSESQCTSSDSIADGINDYDSTTGTKGTRKKFICKSSATATSPPCLSATVNQSNPDDTISYPFNPDAEPDIAFLREEAERQGNYYATRTNIDSNNYPSGSSKQTVFYVNGQGEDVSYNVSEGHAAKGTIVVENGNVTMTGNVAFEGIIIITGDGTNTGKYTTSGTPDLKGFVIADSKMTIRGDVTPFTVTEEFTTRPGFYGVNLWSWRELYE